MELNELLYPLSLHQDDLAILSNSVKQIGHPIPISQLKNIANFRRAIAVNKMIYSGTNWFTSTNFSLTTILIICILGYIAYKMLQQKLIKSSTSIKNDIMKLHPTRPVLRRQQQRRMSLPVVEYHAADEIASIYELPYHEVSTNPLPTPPSTPATTPTPIPRPRTFISLHDKPEN